MRGFISLLHAHLHAGGGMATHGTSAAFFAVLTASLFGIALAPMPAVMAQTAPAVIWLCVVLAATLSLESAWHRPLTTGWFDLVLLSGIGPLPLAIAASLGHWMCAGLPLILAGCLAGVMLSLPLAAFGGLISSLLCATLYLSLTGSMAAVLTHGARQAGLLTVVLILPLQVPMLLLALMAVERAQLDPAAFNPYVAFQAALLLISAPALLGGIAWLIRAQASR